MKFLIIPALLSSFSLVRVTIPLVSHPVVNHRRSLRLPYHSLPYDMVAHLLC